MNILFLTLVAINDIEDKGIYQDLLRKFRDEGHKIFVATAAERRTKQKTHVLKFDTTEILKVRTLNIKNANIVEKGLGTLLMERQYLKAIQNNWKSISFDLVLYSTPPITFTRVIAYIKNRDQALSYLLLKDIFPQNAVDMGMMKKQGLLYKLFRKKEEKLYEVSDAIGCMSPANVKYLSDNNNLTHTKIEVSPNSIEPSKLTTTAAQKEKIKLKYGLPLDKRILVYGGNLGQPQGLDFLLETIEKSTHQNLFFLVVGNGTEFKKIQSWFTLNRPSCALLLNRLSKRDYDELIAGCDVGLIFLSPKFTIPNFPSRLLPYLEMKMPVLAATDTATDIGKILLENSCGFWIESGDYNSMDQVLESINSMTDKELNGLGDNALRLLYKEYTVDKSYNIIMDTLKELKTIQ